MHVSVWTVQQGLVYRVCGKDGRWAQKNTSECEDDPGQVRCVYTVLCLCVRVCAWDCVDLAFHMHKLFSCLKPLGAADGWIILWLWLTWQFYLTWLEINQRVKIPPSVQIIFWTRFTSFVPNLIYSVLCGNAMHGSNWLSLSCWICSSSMDASSVSFGSCIQWDTRSLWELCYWPWQSSLPSGRTCTGLKRRNK